MYSISTTSVNIIIINIDSKLQLSTESYIPIRSYILCRFYKLINVSE